MTQDEKTRSDAKHLMQRARKERDDGDSKNASHTFHSAIILFQRISEEFQIEEDWDNQRYCLDEYNLLNP